jgi:hypothetical protein
LKPSATESKIIFYYGRRSIPRPWAIREEEFLVLADSLRCARLEASLAHHRVRRLRTVIDLDLTVKRRDPDASIRVALNDVRCPRCNGHGRTRIVGPSRYPSPQNKPMTVRKIIVALLSLFAARAGWNMWRTRILRGRKIG